MLILLFLWLFLCVSDYSCVRVVLYFPRRARLFVCDFWGLFGVDANLDDFEPLDLSHLEVLIPVVRPASCNAMQCIAMHVSTLP
jgi:hypothetical protein